jgi:DNA repair protein RadC
MWFSIEPDKLESEKQHAGAGTRLCIPEETRPNEMYQLNPSDSSNTRIGDLPQSSRPREKLMRLGGVTQLDDHDLLCLSLGTGGPAVSVGELARELAACLFPLQPRDSLPALDELTAIKGMGVAKASSLLAGLELGRRSVLSRGRPILEPRDALSHLLWMQPLGKEHFHALYLDTRRFLIAAETVSVGTLDSSLVHPREVYRPALLHAASAVLVAHNHPSGDPEPSAEDLALTRRLDKAARLLGLSLLDHLVVARRGFVSLRERQRCGRLPVELFAA